MGEAGFTVCSLRIESLSETGTNVCSTLKFRSINFATKSQATAELSIIRLLSERPGRVTGDQKPVLFPQCCLIRICASVSDKLTIFTAASDIIAAPNMSNFMFPTEEEKRQKRY